MKPASRTAVISAVIVPALAIPAFGEDAQDQQGSNQQQQAQQPQAQQDLRDWDVTQLYRDTWSADEMIGTEVRGANGEQIGEVRDIFVGRDGSVSRLLVEVGGFLEMGDQHIGVPWQDVEVGQDLQWVRVPLREVESGTYSIYGNGPQGEDVPEKTGEWRVNELMGDYASLMDAPRYGLVTDVIFNEKGKALGVIIDRAAGSWGPAGWYGYPYYGYTGAYTYGLPYRGAAVGDYARFDYAQFARLSQYAGDESAQRQEEFASRSNRSNQGNGNSQ